ncbi:MAG: hypothetical protein MJY56_04495 [Bacteroidales bacterium]|nr:hypothetical protein [Bacteroidales bacterium]
MGGWTGDLFARVVVPLFSPRVNLSVWMPVVEWYDSGVCRGYGFGDVNVSTEIHVLRERKWSPDILLRAAWKSASGEQYEYSRHYDCPGYFFDMTVGKSFAFEGSWVESVRVAANVGFLCWQTNISRQNDAVMYGAKAIMTGRWLGASAELAGYAGWQLDRDRPMTVRARIYGRLKGFEPYIQYGYGIKDYPFHQLRVGLVYNIDILSGK